MLGTCGGAIDNGLRNSFDARDRLPADLTVCGGVGGLVEGACMLELLTPETERPGPYKELPPLILCAEEIDRVLEV